MALLEYYGALNEMELLMESAPMVAPSVTIPDKPEALKLWEQCQALGVPLCAGGLADQPHIWLEEVGVILDVQQTFALQRKGKDHG